MLEKLDFCVKRLSILSITVFLIGGMVGCGLFPQNVEIRTWYDLYAVRNNLGGHYILMNDLDSTTDGYEELASPIANGGKGWQPIGTSHNTFAGTFDGQGYKIYNLFSNRPGEMYVGLFSAVGEGGVVQNIGVVNADVTGYGGVGGLAGDSEGTVSNSYATGIVNGTGWVGGLMGVNLGTVSKSYSTAIVTGDERVGGLVGWNEGSEASVSNSYSTGTITGRYSVGGLVGASSGTVSNSYSEGSVTGDSSVGGLVGDNLGTVSYSFWDIQTSGQATSDGGTGKNTTEMQDPDTFSGVGWNIIEVANPGTRNPSYIWNIVNGVTYPFLSWQS
jgi:hypothetical protein